MFSAFRTAFSCDPMENGTLVLARNPSRLEFAEAIKMDLLIARETQPAQTLDALVRADERLTSEFQDLSAS